MSSESTLVVCSVAVALAAAGLLPGCDDGIGCSDCGEDGSVCPASCRPPCESDEDCDRLLGTGHRCEGEGPDRQCSAECDPTRCAELGPRLECRGTCVEVECSERVPCLDGTQICDVLGRCYPRSGACAPGELAPCPELAPEVTRSASIECSGGVCRLRPRSHEVSVNLSVEPVQILSPSDSERLYTSAEDVLFRWGPRASTHIVLVLRAPPLTKEDLPRFAIWGAVTSSGDSDVTWREGRDISAGAWLDTTSDPPLATPLWLLVQALQESDLVGLSRVEPFAVGGTPPWAVPGEVCDGADDCASPLQPLLCVAGRCRVACASDADCRAAGLELCRDPEDGARLCQ